MILSVIVSFCTYCAVGQLFVTFANTLVDFCLDDIIIFCGTSCGLDEGAASIRVSGLEILCQMVRACPDQLAGFRERVLERSGKLDDQTRDTIESILFRPFQPETSGGNATPSDPMLTTPRMESGLGATNTPSQASPFNNPTAGTPSSASATQNISNSITTERQDSAVRMWEILEDYPESSLSWSQFQATTIYELKKPPEKLKQPPKEESDLMNMDDSKPIKRKLPM